VPMSTPPVEPPTPPAESGSPEGSSALPPAMRDVRLVVEAVQSAEDAALAYAREIGEARRHLSEAIAHLDRADEARALLNRLAAGFGPQGAGSAGPANAEPPAPAPAPGFGGPAQGERSVTTPSPGIAIARPSEHFSGPRGSAADEPSVEPGHPGVANHGTNGGDSSSTHSGSSPYPAVPPPPRPGGWGPGTSGVQ
jgi:hypothetical protein